MEKCVEGCACAEYLELFAFPARKINPSTRQITTAAKAFFFRAAKTVT
jgi:hypothetical protein